MMALTDPFPRTLELGSTSTIALVACPEVYMTSTNTRFTHGLRSGWAVHASSCLGVCSSLVLAHGFVVEARKEVEMPERMMCACKLQRLVLDKELRLENLALEAPGLGIAIVI